MLGFLNFGTPKARNTNHQNYIILFEGRTGSSMLIDHLSSHPRMVAKPELLVGKNEKEQRDWMAQLYNNNTDPNIQAIGFKTKLRDVANPDAFHSLLEKHKVKVIYLYRENLVKLAVSRINALRLHAETKQWNLEAGQQQLPPIHVPVAQFEEALAFRRGYEETLQNFMQKVTRPTLRLTYETLLASPEEVFTAIFDFLGVDHYPLTSKLRKNTPDNLRDIILNFDELKAHYQGTELEAMFE